MQEFESEERRKRQRQESDPLDSDAPQMGQAEFSVPAENIPFTPTLNVNPTAYPYIHEPTDNIPFLPVQEANPFRPIHVNPIGRPNLYDQSQNPSPFPIATEDIPVAVRNVIDGIPMPCAV
jgi:hypothetical protein